MLIYRSCKISCRKIQSKNYSAQNEKKSSIKMIPDTTVVKKKIKNVPRQPFVTILPIFCSRPLLDRGIPIFREIFDFIREIPKNRLHENPPRFISQVSLKNLL